MRTICLSLIHILCGLYGCVENHEYDWEQVANDTVSRYAVGSHIIHKNIVAGTNHNGYRYLTKEYGKAELNHITYIPERQQQTLDTQFQPHEPYGYRMPEQIDNHNGGTNKLSYICCCLLYTSRCV